MKTNDNIKSNRELAKEAKKLIIPDKPNTKIFIYDSKTTIIYDPSKINEEKLRFKLDNRKKVV